MADTLDSMRHALEAASDGYWDWNLVTGETYYSDGFLRLLGLAREEIRPHVSLWEERMHPEDVPRVFAAIAGVLDRADSLVEATYRMRTRSGEYVWVRDRGRVVERDAEGKAARMAGIFVEIGSRVAAEVERDRRRRLTEQTLKGAVAVALVTVDAEGRILLANRGAEAMLGRYEDDLIGRSVLDWFDAGAFDALAQRVSEVSAARLSGAAVLRSLSHGEASGADVALRLDDGTTVPAHMFVHPSEHGVMVLTLVPLGKQGGADSGTPASLREDLERKAEGAVIVSEQGEILFANAIFAEVLGYSAPELGRLSFWKILHPDDAAQLRPAIAGEAGAYEGAVRIRRRSRDWSWFDVSAVDMRATPAVGGYVLLLRDITARKRRVAEIERDAERFRLGARQANLGLWDWDIVTGELYWSDQIGHLFGYGEDLPETTYANFLARIHPDDRAAVEQAVSRAVSERARYDIDHRVVWLDGTVRWVNERGDVIYGNDGAPIRMLGVVQDVTEKREAAQALRDREERIRALLENSFEGVMAIGADSKVIFASAGAQRIYGLRADEMNEDAITARLHPDDVAEVQDLWVRVTAEPGARTRTVSRVMHRSGVWRWVEFSISNLLHLPSVEAVVINMRDVTDRKWTEEQLLERERRFRYLASQAPVGIFQTDRGGAAVFVNAHMAAFMGRQAEDLMGDGWAAFVAPEDADRVTEAWGASLTTGREFRIEFRYLHADGSKRWLALVGLPIREPDGSVSGFITAASDITDQVDALTTLRESEMRTRAIFDSVSDAVLTVRRSGLIVAANAAAERMFGFDAGRMAGERVGVLAAGEELKPLLKIASRFRRAGPAPASTQMQMTAVRRGGERFPAEIKVSAVRIDGEDMFTAVIRDVAEEQRVQRIKDELISTVNHELRTPLTSIRGTLGLLLGGASLSAEESAQLLTVAVRNTERLSRLINDFLDLAKLEAGERLVSPAPGDAAALVDEAVRGMAGYATECGVALRWARPAAPATAVFDGERLLQVLNNLLSNALKFSPAGEAVEVAVEPAGAWVRISVADRGPGIPEEFRPRLFQKFAQADASDRRNRQGSGLGLSIARSLVIDMGGSIGFRDRPGGGTVFEVDLPAEPLSS